MHADFQASCTHGFICQKIFLFINIIYIIFLYGYEEHTPKKISQCTTIPCHHQKPFFLSKLCDEIEKNINKI